MNNGNGVFSRVKHQICTIRPRWLTVNVTYVRDGFVTFEPLSQQLPDTGLTSSSVILTAISYLKDHFANSQTMFENHVVNTIYMLAFAVLPQGREDPQFPGFVTKAMVSTHCTIAP